MFDRYTETVLTNIGINIIMTLSVYCPLSVNRSTTEVSNPAVYLFKLGAIYAFDGGKTWSESELPLKPGWDGMSDPTVAFDTFGNAFVVGGPVRLK